MSAPDLSVVVATYNRPELLERLLRALASQSLPASRFEVVVVDDGSQEPVAPRVERLGLPLQLKLVRQANGGAAAARHRGALEARGEVLVIVDDDMQLAPDFLTQHLALHPPGSRHAVMGRIRPDPALQGMPLFERYNASRLDKMAALYAQGAVALQGNNLCTGNVSMRRADYLASGGFDPALKRSEDAELGLRLEKLGVQFRWCEQGYVLHGSDHRSLEGWLASAKRYGVFDLRIARKHPDLAHADPWRYFFSLQPAIRPFLGLAVAAPGAAGKLTSAAMRAAELAGKARLEGVALRATGLVYGMEYFRGIREESGTLRGALQSAGDYLAKAAQAPEGTVKAPKLLSAVAGAARDLAEDRRTRHGYEDKYGYAGEKGGSLPAELATKIGLQISAGYRAMRAFRGAGLPLGAKVASRLMRHLYGSDIHWDAEFAPGVMFVHGMGLAISHAAKVGPGCILNQNVTLGMGIDPKTRQTGAPTLEANVHVGAGATLVGPITVGANSKIMPGVVLTESVPPNSIVEAPAPRVRSRVQGVASRSAAGGE